MHKIKDNFQTNKTDYLITMTIYAVTMVTTLLFIAQ